jgi:hypothetical protein
MGIVLRRWQAGIPRDPDDTTMSPILSRRSTSIALRTLGLVVGGVLLLAVNYQYSMKQGRRHALARDSAIDAAIRHALDPATLVVEESGMPRFEAYPVADTFAGTPAPVDLNSAEGAREIAAVLREEAAKGPNFAGHYTVVSWNDEWRRMFAIVDARTGRVTFGPHYVSFGLGHRLNSSLLITDPVDQWRKEYGPDSKDLAGAYAESHYYQWNGERLVHLDVLTLGTEARASRAMHTTTH